MILVSAYSAWYHCANRVDSTLLVVPDVDAWKGTVVEEVVFCFHFRIVSLGVSNPLGECRCNTSRVLLAWGGVHI